VAGPLIRPRPAGRPAAGHANRLAGRLTERDRRIALDCYDHRVLTTEQLRRLHFKNTRIAQRRLTELYQLRLLDRFRPVWRQGEGSTPYHWLLDHAGAQVVAALLDLPLEQLGWRRDHTHALASSSKLNHQLAVNDFFSRLAEDARARGGALAEWWGERRTAAAFAGRLAPDGYGRLQLANKSTPFLLELDRGSEPHQRLRQKADRYTRELPRSDLAHQQPLVLLLTPTSQRTAAAAESLGGSSVPIHTATWTPASDRSPLELVQAAARHHNAIPRRP
jgi:hypothetical protein